MKIVDRLSLSQKVFYNTFIQLLGKLITAGVTFLVVVLLTRRFGPVGFGDYSIIVSYVMLYLLVIDFGINAIAVRDLAPHPQKIQEYYNNLSFLRLFFAFGVIVLSWTILIFLPYSPFIKTSIIILTSSFLAESVISTNNIVFQTNLRLDKIVLSRSISYLIRLFLVLLVIFLKKGVREVIFVVVFSDFLTAFISLWLVKNYVKLFRFVFNKNLWRYLLTASLPMGVAIIFNLIFFKDDIFFLSFLPLSRKFNLTNSEAVGFYNAAYKVLELVLVVPSFFMNATYPILSKQIIESKERFKKSLNDSFSVLLSFGAFAAGVTFLFSRFLIKIIGGAEFVAGGSVDVLKILSIPLPLFFISSLFMWTLIVLKKQWLLCACYGITALVNIPLNVIFIPRYGFYGAAVITGVTEFVVLSLTFYNSVKFLGFFPKFNPFWWREYSRKICRIRFKASGKI